MRLIRHYMKSGSSPDLSFPRNEIFDIGGKTAGYTANKGGMLEADLSFFQTETADFIGKIHAGLKKNP